MKEKIVKANNEERIRKLLNENNEINIKTPRGNIFKSGEYVYFVDMSGKIHYPTKDGVKQIQA